MNRHLLILSLLCCFFYKSLEAVVDDINISADPGTLTINSATAGSQPDDAVDATTTYSVETGVATRRITGTLDANMPANVTLLVQLQAPPFATSQGAVSMSTTAANLVTGINALTPVPGLTITYTLQATVDVVAGTSGSRVLTLDLIAP